MSDDFGTGISIERMSFKDLREAPKATADLPEDGRHSHRHDGHSFFLLEKGRITLEIDFQQYLVEAPSVTYVHPDQVHYARAAEDVTVGSLSVTEEKLNPDYLKLLLEMTPAKPWLLEEETFSMIQETMSLCIKVSKLKKDRLYHSFLKDSCNALIALMISPYLDSKRSKDKISRFDTVTKAFRENLERNYNVERSPAAYARELNLTPSYLNECVRSATGHSVSHHIQHRVILEAKRLLYHSDKSVKEIAVTLGYDDYPYFSRLFSKITGMTALAFRNKNSE
ncbi:transcriptional regulator, AraC family protein [Pedobacter sp. BAL39]|nr:transcriptional regulator, AraC family protein [Pedobacter sp. BAL39]